ncbi:MAG: hypothetical protein CVU61_12865 [Deltaproteobacteria bacterium HGW-Deltaproteobacteria-19]|jgi:hypothetical protein|nr:MAG: hypothetical protein CVU61_12865 [Deltaproteobacteria bacterium HGW-Deltaproteobacteria-19]
MRKSSTDKGKRKSSNIDSVSSVIQSNGQGLTEEEFFLSAEGGSASGKKDEQSEEKKGVVPKEQSIRFFLPEVF